MQPYERLERDFAKWAGFEPEQMVVCSSGTSALHLAAEAMGLRDSRCAMPDFTMIACPRAVSMAGMRPAFVDCKKDLTIDVDKLHDACEKGRFEGVNDVAAIMPVHVYGRSCDMPAIADLAGKYDLRVIEDLAEAHGLPPHPNTDAACWSFFRNKVIAGEEGGAVAFKDAKHAAHARQLRSLGFTDAHDYTHVPRGHNYRLANSLASLIGTSLERVRENVARRWIAYGEWDRACPEEWKMTLPEVPWVYSLRVPGMWSELQTSIVSALRKRGFEARHGFKPCRRQEEYRSLPIPDEWESDRAAREVIYLPVDRPVPATEAEDLFETVKTMIG